MVGPTTEARVVFPTPVAEPSHRAPRPALRAVPYAVPPRVDESGATGAGGRRAARAAPPS
ncbi:hypothetical protein ABID92_001138 [Frigoribacterium sp. PvP120]|uniref:hypothetical protein n=1 Tax=unclassified Frigoribacterium TaxID=2627005 RepID=UPI001AE22B3C|nr:hypothetical protein [Frigoribacterium sp. PvP121]MBP1241045.1 hypothetical protein [Frigoribacterium sp. PvP121]